MQVMNFYIIPAGVATSTNTEVCKSEEGSLPNNLHQLDLIPREEVDTK